jgi:hypothetical protein
MFAWFVNLFRKQPPLGEEFSLTLYKPSEMAVYRYWDGSKIVAVDPMVLHRRVSDAGREELAIDLKVSARPIKGNVEAYDSLLRKIRKIFNVVPFDGAVGLTEVATVELLDHWLNYEYVQKKIANLPPTSPAASSPPSSNSSAGSPPTGSSSGSGSTGTGPSTDTPPPSPSGPESPSGPSNPDSNTSPP